jgi:hypothetical protein
VWVDAREETASRRLWAAIVVSTDLYICRSIILGRPVIVRRLDPSALRHALRGARPPAPTAYIRIRSGHLDAIAEALPEVRP